jgi:pilus assembly protein Flp/PilA
MRVYLVRTKVKNMLVNSGSNRIRLGTAISKFLRDESGAPAIEYGLIAAGISVAVIGAVKLVGTNLNSAFTSVSTALK